MSQEHLITSETINAGLHHEELEEELELSALQCDAVLLGGLALFVCCSAPLRCLCVDQCVHLIDDEAWRSKYSEHENVGVVDAYAWINGCLDRCEPLSNLCMRP